MNIGKIIKIIEDTAYIGYEDGSLKEIGIKDCDFEPAIGDYVEVYGDIVIKVESSTVKKHNSIKTSFSSKIKPILIALIVIVLSVSAYFIVSKITTSQNISSSSKFSALSSKNKSNSSSSQESSSSSTKSSISGNIPKNLLTIDYEERTDKQKYSSSFDYDKWIHDEFPHYLKLHVRGEVVQILKDQDDKGILIQIVLNEIGRPGLGKPVSVFIPGDYLSDIIVEGDKLDLYGKTYGVKQYSSGDSVVMRPFMIAYFYERDK